MYFDPLYHSQMPSFLEGIPFKSDLSLIFCSTVSPTVKESPSHSALSPPLSLSVIVLSLSICTLTLTVKTKDQTIKELI